MQLFLTCWTTQSLSILCVTIETPCRLMELFWEQHKNEVTAVWQVSGWVSQLSPRTNQTATAAASNGDCEEASEKVSAISGVPCVGVPGATSAFVMKLAKTEDLEGRILLIELRCNFSLSKLSSLHQSSAPKLPVLFSA